MGGFYESDTKELCAKQIIALKEELQSNVIPLGSITHGVLRHRVLLLYVLPGHILTWSST